MLFFRAIKLFSSSARSKFSTHTHSNRFSAFSKGHPPSTIFPRHLTSTTDRSKVEDHSGAASLDEVAKGVVHLQCESSAEGGVCHVYLVGTCHVSQKSCQDVKAVINYLKPQAVFLELCQRRVNILTSKTFKVPTMWELLNIWKNKKANPFDIFISHLYKMVSEQGLLPGAEMRVAYEEASSYRAYIYLGDRPYHITSRRAWNAITMSSLMKFLYHMHFKSDIWKQTIKKLKQGDEPKYILQMRLKELEEDEDTLAAEYQELCKAFPSLMEVIIVERDKYMSRTLWNVARKHSSVVAVVGKAHLSGIKNYWMQPIEVESLLEVPSRKEDSSISKIFARASAIKHLVVAWYNRSKK